MGGTSVWGWYRDGAQFDFHSCWAFQFYAPIWARAFGYKRMGRIARILEKNHLAMQKTYALLFGRNGFSPMWGRSIMYRCAASAPLAAAFLLKKQAVGPSSPARLQSPPPPAGSRRGSARLQSRRIAAAGGHSTGETTRDGYRY